jgi:transcriptional regulator with XRE-family HTH domain
MQEVFLGLDRKIFSDRLRQLRTDAGLTGEALAGKVRLNRTAIVNLERGVRGPSIDTVFELAEALNVSADYLMGLPLRDPPLPGWLVELLPDLWSLDRPGQEAVKALVRGLKR